MDPHGRFDTFYSPSKSQVCNGREFNNHSCGKRHGSNDNCYHPYVEINEDAMECAFRSFEVAISIYVKKRFETLTPRLSKNTWMGIRQTLGKGVKVGSGLGKNLQERKRVI